MRAIKVASACVAVSLGAGCGFFDSPLLKACEEAIQMRLAAPAGYKRVDYRESVKPISDEDYLEFQTRNDDDALKAAFMRDFAKDRGSPTIYVVDVKYDAPNVYGTPIRSSSTCEYIDATSPKNASFLTVTLDGLRFAEWSR